MSDDSRSPRANFANPEMLTAVSALVIGACALVVAFYEVRIMRADQRSSVLPLVELSRSTYRTARGDSVEPVAVTHLNFNAENVGIGPAKVVDFHVTVDGRPLKTWAEAVQALVGRDESIDYGSSTIMGRTIPAGQRIDMFSITDTELAGEINANVDRLDFEACFVPYSMSAGWQAIRPLAQSTILRVANVTRIRFRNKRHDHLGWSEPRG